MNLLRMDSRWSGTSAPRPEAAAGMARIQSPRVQHEDRAELAHQRAFLRALGD